MKSFALLASALASASLVVSTAVAQSPQTIDEVIVTSSRIEQPLRQTATAVSVITREEIELKGYTSASELLRNETSVGVSNAGGEGKQTTLRIRGEEGYRTLVLIDGIDMSDPSGIQVGPLFENIGTTMDVERIEILRGAQGFSYGADAGGVVNIITRSIGEGSSGGMRLELGELGAQNLGGHVSTGTGRLGISAAASRTKNDGFNARQSDITNEADGYENTTLHLKASAQISDNFFTDVVFRDIELESEFDDCGFSTPRSNNCLTANAQRNIKLSFGNRESQSISIARTSVQRDSLVDDALSFATDAETLEVEYIGAYRIADHTVVTGLDYEEQSADTNYGSYGDNEQRALFAEYLFTGSDQYFLSAGARYDDHSVFGSNLSYRVASSFIQAFPSSELKYRASIGTGFRAPSLSEVSTNMGPYGNGIELVEENSAGFDLGLDWVLENGLSISLTYFDQEIDNQIEYDYSSYAYIQEDGRSTSKGMEVEIDYLVSENWLVEVNFTDNDAKDTDGNDRLRRPDQIANVGLTYSPLERIRLRADIRASRGALDFGGPLDDYEVINLSGKYDISEDVSMFLRVQNLLDEDYQEILGFNTAGRNIFAGVNFEF